MKFASRLYLYSRRPTDSYESFEKTYHSFSMPWIYFTPSLGISRLVKAIILVKDCPE